jgi:hypothetical protein
MHNDKGKFIAGFAYKKDFVASPQQVELMAIKDGIEFLQAIYGDCSSCCA